MADNKPIDDANQWFAVYTRSRYEKKVASDLLEKGTEAWAPLIKSLRQWSDRKKMVEVPLFNSYIFVHTSNTKIKDVIREVPGAVYVVSFSGRPTVIPDSEIEDLKKLLGTSERFEVSTETFSVGEKVEVMEGPLKGLKGIFVDYRGQKRTVIRIDAINQSMLIDINPSLIKKTQE
jgi:transcriptional antiterminator RfaH